MKDNTKKTLLIYWQQAKKYRVSAGLMVFGIIGASVIQVVIPLYFKQFFDILVVGYKTEAAVAELIKILVIIAAFEAGAWLCWRLATFTANYFQSKVMTDLVDYCFGYLHQHSFSFFSNNFVGSLVKKVKWFGRSFETIADRFFWNLLTLAVNIIVITIVLLQRNYILAFVVLIWVTIFLAINGIFTKYKLVYDIRRSEAETKTTAYLADTITNNNAVKLFNGFSREVRGFAAINDDLRKLRKFTWDLDALFEALQGFLMVFLELGIFYLAINLWRQGILTVGDFVLIQAYLIDIFHRVWDFGKVIRYIYEALADAEEMTVILNAPWEITDIAGAKNLNVNQGEIEFKNVDFYYHQTRKILDNFNLNIKPQEHVALIGPSGAGKTTVVKLILRMHDVDAGQILIDGQNIAQTTQESLWENISLVPQDPILFHRPLMENIRYGRPEATDEEVVAAAKLAHCHEFITLSPDGYNTYVGERGIKLSGGERQRVAIARAILRNSPILVLDEATSSLDSESERLIQDALEKLMTGKTVIVIAHRLSTIRQMDRIIVIDNGQIIEEGSHAQLISHQTGLYQRLWQLQAGGFIK
jgi:ATP-binding cassette subfamily B protein